MTRGRLESLASAGAMPDVPERFRSTSRSRNSMRRTASEAKYRDVMQWDVIEKRAKARYPTPPRSHSTDVRRRRDASRSPSPASSRGYRRLIPHGPSPPKSVGDLRRQQGLVRPAGAIIVGIHEALDLHSALRRDPIAVVVRYKTFDGHTEDRLHAQIISWEEQFEFPVDLDDSSTEQLRVYVIHPGNEERNAVLLGGNVIPVNLPQLRRNGGQMTAISILNKADLREKERRGTAAPRNKGLGSMKISINYGERDVESLPPKDQTKVESRPAVQSCEEDSNAMVTEEEAIRNVHVLSVVVGRGVDIEAPFGVPLHVAVATKELEALTDAAQVEWYEEGDPVAPTWNQEMRFLEHDLRDNELDVMLADDASNILACGTLLIDQDAGTAVVDLRAPDAAGRRCGQLFVSWTVSQPPAKKNDVAAEEEDAAEVQKDDAAEKETEEPAEAQQAQDETVAASTTEAKEEEPRSATVENQDDAANDNNATSTTPAPAEERAAEEQDAPAEKEETTTDPESEEAATKTETKQDDRDAAESPAAAADAPADDAPADDEEATKTQPATTTSNEEAAKEESPKEDGDKVTEADGAERDADTNGAKEKKAPESSTADTADSQPQDASDAAEPVPEANEEATKSTTKPHEDSANDGNDESTERKEQPEEKTEQKSSEATETKPANEEPSAESDKAPEEEQQPKETEAGILEQKRRNVEAMMNRLRNKNAKTPQPEAEEKATEETTTNATDEPKDANNTEATDANRDAPKEEVVEKKPAETTESSEANNKDGTNRESPPEVLATPKPREGQSPSDHPSSYSMDGFASPPLNFAVSPFPSASNSVTSALNESRSAENSRAPTVLKYRARHTHGGEEVDDVEVRFYKGGTGPSPEPSNERSPTPETNVVPPNLPMTDEEREIYRADVRENGALAIRRATAEARTILQQAIGVRTLKLVNQPYAAPAQHRPSFFPPGSVESTKMHIDAETKFEKNTADLEDRIRSTSPRSQQRSRSASRRAITSRSASAQYRGAWNSMLGGIEVSGGV